jgi:hypothetical protein
LVLFFKKVHFLASKIWQERERESDSIFLLYSFSFHFMSTPNTPSPIDRSTWLPWHIQPQAPRLIDQIHVRTNALSDTGIASIPFPEITKKLLDKHNASTIAQWGTVQIYLGDCFPESGFSRQRNTVNGMDPLTRCHAIHQWADTNGLIASWQNYADAREVYDFNKLREKFRTQRNFQITGQILFRKKGES